MDVIEALERATPLRTEIAPDWLDVVRRSQRRRRVWPAAAIAACLAAAAFALISLWPSGGGVLQRARAAIGDAPVVHVVYRSEAHETLVDLSTGARTPVYEIDEQWYEPNVGMRTVTQIGGVVLSDAVVAPDQGFQAQTAAGALDGYRAALANGDASIAGTDTVAGHDVYWIAFKPEQLPDVGDGKTHAFAEQVAIDRTTYRPVYIRFTRDGVPGPGTGEAILSVDTLAAGSVDLTPHPPARPPVLVMSRSDVTDVTGNLAAAAARLGHSLLWLGETYNGHSLAYAQASTATASQEHGPVVELCYGPTAAPTVAGPATCDITRPGVRVQESTAPVIGRGPVDVAVPEGSALVDWSGRSVYLRRDGVYLYVTGPTEGQALAAVRALQEAKVSR